MDIISAVESIIHEAEQMAGAYFYAPPTSAGARRAYEKRHTHAAVEWNDGGHVYTAEYTVRCTCRNVYASGTYTRDGMRTTLTAIKNSVKRMKGE